MYSNVNYCSQCGLLFNSKASFCINCGNQRVRETSVDQYEKNHCKNCGELPQSNDKFCPRCGVKGIHSTTMQDNEYEWKKQDSKESIIKSLFFSI